MANLSTLRKLNKIHYITHQKQSIHVSAHLSDFFDKGQTKISSSAVSNVLLLQASVDDEMLLHTGTNRSCFERANLRKSCLMGAAIFGEALWEVTSLTGQSASTNKVH